MRKTALVIGATGLVGNQLVKTLLEDDRYEEVKIFVRRSVEIDHKKLTEYIIDFNFVEQWKSKVTGDVLYSTLGTTIKQAGSKEEQHKVDFIFQFNFAKVAAENGVKQLVLVSSLGANPKSSVFYSRMKGELDLAVKYLTFDYIHIIRPSALVGNRPKERAGEKVMINMTNFFVRILPFLKKYKPIDATIVAQAMVSIADQEMDDKYHIWNNLELFSFSK